MRRPSFTIKKTVNIGFISTRIADTDGVSLEIKKWTDVLERNGLSCFFYAGEIDRDKEKSYLVDEAHFEHPDVKKIYKHSFGKTTRPHQISALTHAIKDKLKKSLRSFVKRYDIDLIITENALTIPMNIPLGLAITEFIAETGIRTIAHHHDFYWERDRFLINSVSDYLHMAFPPSLPTIQHVVINSLASNELSYRVGLSNTVIPNVYNFTSPPQSPDPEVIREIRGEIGLEDDDLFVLQPTRIVPRKWIERSIELVHQLRLRRPVLVISHASGDEGSDYFRRIKEYARLMKVELKAIDHLIAPDRNTNNHGNKKYTIEDVYHAADLVTYLTGYEGFGNAFLEAVYYKKPIVVNRYSIFIADIEPKGFDLFITEGFISKKTINRIQAVFKDDRRREEMTQTNFNLARMHFSYERLEKLLLGLLVRFNGI